MQQLFGQKVLNDFIQKQDEKLIENRWQSRSSHRAKRFKNKRFRQKAYNM